MVPPSSTDAAGKVLAAFTRTPLSGELLSLARSRNLPLILAGGFVRDALMGTGDPRDIDLTVPVDPGECALEWARIAGGALVPLDPERGTYRVARKIDGRLWYWDFTAFRGKDLAADLQLRDFTVNALAFPLHPLGSSIIDPTGGLADLSGRVIRRTGPGAFEEDPLRKLRAYRFAAQLGFSIHPETEACLAGDDLTDTVSGERIREELWNLLSAGRTLPFISLLVEGGILAALWAPGGPDVAFYGRFEESADAARGDLGDFLSGTGAHAAPRRALLKLLALQLPSMEDMGSSGARIKRHLLETAAFLALSRAAVRFLAASLDAMSETESDPGRLDTAEGPWEYFDRHHEGGLGGLMLSWARHPGRIPSFPEEMAVFHRRRYLPDLEAPRLLAAEEVSALSGLRPGPELGEVLRCLAMARRLGAVATPGEARAWLAGRFPGGPSEGPAGNREPS